MSGYRVVQYDGDKLPSEYEAMVFSQWIYSLRSGNDYFKLIKYETFYPPYHAYVSKILSQAKVRIAMLVDDPDIALGFSVSRDGILDYVYVDKLQRKQGIGTKLLPPNIDTITHLTRTALTIWGSKYSHWAFNPFV